MMQFCLVGILVHLLQHDKTTAKELSEKFELSPRTIFRYIDILACNGIPVETTKGFGGGISINKNFCLNASLLNEDEKDYLFTVLAHKSDSTAKKLVNKLNLSS